MLLEKAVGVNEDLLIVTFRDSSGYLTEYVYAIADGGWNDSQSSLKPLG